MDRHKLSVQVNKSAVTNHSAGQFVFSQSEDYAGIIDQWHSRSYRQAKIIEAVNILPSPHSSGKQTRRYGCWSRHFPAIEALNSDEPLSDLVKQNLLFVQCSFKLA